MQSYMSYTIHYIDSDWQLQIADPEDHTGMNLAEAMEVALYLWDLDAANQICLLQIMEVIL